MSYIKRFFAFCYNFLIGEDLLGGIIVLIGFGITYFVARAGVRAYWIDPLAVLVSIISNIWRRLNKES